MTSDKLSRRDIVRITGIGGSDDDPWVDHDLLRDTASEFESMGASVDFQTYPGVAYAVNQDEINQVRATLAEAKRSN